MRVIFIAETGHYRKWGPKNYFDLLTFVQKHDTQNKINLFFSDDPRDNLKEYMASLNPDIILFFDTNTFSETLEKFKFVFNFGAKVGLALLDMFYPRDLLNNEFVKKMNFLVHFSLSEKIVKYYSKLFPKKRIYCLKSRYINTKKFKDYKLDKKYDIVFYGTRRYYKDFASENFDPINDYIKKWEKTNKRKISNEINFYPLRERLENLLVNNKKYKVFALPEKNSYESQVKNQDLSHLLNSSRMAVACSTIADICMHKYLEIISSHCMVLGNIPSDYQKLFKGRICEVTDEMSDEEILSKIDSFLSDKKKLEEQTHELYRKIQKEHNYNEAIADFNSIFEQVYSSK